MLALLRTGTRAHRAARSRSAILATRRPTRRPRLRDIPAVPFGTWEVLRQGRDSRDPRRGHHGAARARRRRVARRGRHRSDGGELPLPQAVRRGHARGGGRQHQHVLVVEEGTMVNGFGAYIGHGDRQIDPAVRVGVHGVPDRYHRAGAAQSAARPHGTRCHRHRAPRARAARKRSGRRVMRLGVDREPELRGAAERHSSRSSPLAPALKIDPRVRGASCTTSAHRRRAPDRPLRHRRAAHARRRRHAAARRAPRGGPADPDPRREPRPARLPHRVRARGYRARARALAAGATISWSRA